LWRNGTARIVVTLSGLTDQAYSVLLNDQLFASNYTNISQYVIIEVEIVWPRGIANSTQLLLTATSYNWSTADQVWYPSIVEDQAIMTVHNGGLYFVTLYI
jgi:hypothetical protein